MSRWIDADALIAELQKDEERFDKEAEDCRKNSSNYTDCYMQAMSSRADGKEQVMKWKPIKGATNAPKGMRWWNNGESRFGGNYRHELRPEPQPIGKGTDETQTDARHQSGLDSLRD